jgi:hypothetical protein
MEMEQQLLQEDKKPNALAFQVSLIFSIYALILIIVLKAMGMDSQSPDATTGVKVISGILNWVPFIFAIVYVQTKHRKDLGGFITYGRAFSAGFRTSAYIGLFLGLLIFIYFQFIDKAAMDAAADAAIQKADGNQQQIDGIKMMKPYFAITGAFASAIMYTLSGLILSLISAAIIKKEPTHRDLA